MVSARIDSVWVEFQVPSEHPNFPSTEHKPHQVSVACIFVQETPGTMSTVLFGEQSFPGSALVKMSRTQYILVL